MKVVLRYVIILSSALFVHMCHAAGVTDKRLTPITAAQLQRAIMEIPPRSPLQQELLSRASASHLMNVAYSQYTILWRRQPNSPYVNLLRGVSAEYLQSDSMDPSLRKFYQQDVYGNLFLVAASCLQKAAGLVPNSSVVNLEDGFYLWQFGNEMPLGLEHLKKALVLAPYDPRVHAIWGLIYSNSSTPGYDPSKAVEHLKTAVKLDPSYAFPHELLSNIYENMRRNTDAAREHKAYLSLIPKQS